MKTYTAGIRGSDVQAGFAVRFWRALRADDTEKRSLTEYIIE